MNTKIFVSGATGFQGKPVAVELINKGYKVVSVSSKEINNTEIKLVKGGFDNLSSLKDALKNVNVAIFTLPLIFNIDTAKKMTENFISAAEEQKVALIIFNTSFDFPKKRNWFNSDRFKTRSKKVIR